MENRAEEKWKEIDGYEGLYEVSDFGRIRKLPNKTFMNGNTNSYGYKVVKLTKDGVGKDYKVHRLVAAAFIPQEDGSMSVVNHKDGDKQNNRVENLEWTTRGGNNRHARSVLNLNYCKKPVWQLDRNGKVIALYMSQNAAAEMVNGQGILIASCCNGNADSAYGYGWEYADSKIVNGLLYEIEKARLVNKINTLQEELDILEKNHEEKT